MLAELVIFKVLPNTLVVVLCSLAMPSMPSTHVVWPVLVVFETFDPNPWATRGGGLAGPPIHDPCRSLGGGGGVSRTSDPPRIGLPSLP